MQRMSLSAVVRRCGKICCYMLDARQLLALKMGSGSLGSIRAIGLAKVGALRCDMTAVDWKLL